MQNIKFDLRCFRSENLGFFTLILYPFIIQLRKVVTVDLYFLTLTPLSIILLFYLLVFVSRSYQKIDLVNFILLFAVLFFDLFFWESPGASVYYFSQYYIVEILLYMSLISRLSISKFIVAVKWQTILSISFVVFEILLAGGVNLQAIAGRNLGIGSGSITGLFDEPALLSYAYILNFFIILYGIEKGFVLKRIGVMVLSAIIVIVLLTMTRASIIYLALIFFSIFAFYILALFDYKKRNTWLFSKRKEFFIVSILAAALLFSVQSYIDSRFGDRTELASMSSTLSEHIGFDLPVITANLIYRIDQTQAAINLILENPFGVGPLLTKDMQLNYLTFKNFSNYNSGNLFLDFFAIFGLPIGLVFFYFLFRECLGFVKVGGAASLSANLGFVFVFFNIFIATNFIVAVTSTAVRYIESSPGFYLGAPAFIGPRNIDGFILVTYLCFYRKLKKISY